MKLAIMYLTCDTRHFTFPHFVKHLSQSKHLDEIVLLVLTNTNDSEFYENILKGTKISYLIRQFEEHNNYMNKVFFTLQFTESYEIPYIMKHDNDIILGAPLYDYLFENLSVLEDEKNIVLTPTLTTGIPTCDLFMKDYLTTEEQKHVSDLFKEYRFGPLWGTDYTSLNTYTVDSPLTAWDSSEFYKGVHKIPHHYKGIHPVRMHERAILTLNEYVIKYKDRILSKDEYSLDFDSESTYFCDSIFCIKRSVYETFLNKRELYVDPFDEVPLNKWRDMNKLNYVIVRKGTAIHFMYNCIDNYLYHEKRFIDSL